MVAGALRGCDGPVSRPVRRSSETAYLLRSPANAEHLLRSIADAEAGRIETEELINPEREVA